MATVTATKSHKRKRAPYALFLFLLLFSCTCFPQWKVDKISSCETCFRSQRFYFDDQDPFRRVSVEILDSDSGTRMYINTFSRPLTQNTISITISDKTYYFSAEILEGGQRLLLLDEARDFIISNLLSGNTIELCVGPYKITILPTKFSERFHALS